MQMIDNLYITILTVCVVGMMFYAMHGVIELCKMACAVGAVGW